MPKEPVFSSGHLESLPWRVAWPTPWGVLSADAQGRGVAGGGVNHSAKWPEISALCSVQKVQNVAAREDTGGAGSSGQAERWELKMYVDVCVAGVCVEDRHQQVRPFPTAANTLL